MPEKLIDQTLVTGAAGFIASHLVERLLRDGRAVLGIDNFDPYYPKAMKLANLAHLVTVAARTGTRFEFVETDIRAPDAQAIDAAGGFTDVIHLAAKAGVRPSLADPAGYADTNIQGTIRMLELARERVVRSFVFGSSSSVYGDDTAPPFAESATAVLPISPYAATKRAGELLCHTYMHLHGMRIASLRFFTVYGPAQRPDLAIRKFIDAISRGQSITLYGDGSTSRDYTYVSDIVQGVVSALAWTRRPGAAHEIVNLGGSRTTSLADLVKLIEANLGIAAQVNWQPRQPGDVERTYADVTKAEQLLGYRPQVTIQQGIARMVEWHRATDGGARR